MSLFYDQLGRAINLPAVPKRIVSVVPSQTELLFYLGLDEEVIGITKYCIHPAGKCKVKLKVGGTKQLNINRIKALQPDLIIANKEENDRSQIEELMGVCPVWISDISNLGEALDMITTIGEIVGKSTEAQTISNQITQQFNNFAIQQSNLRAAYFIWRKPYMVAGSSTFIDSMLQKCGFINAFETDRYPEVTPAMLAEVSPDVVLLSSEPYPFKEKHVAEFKAILPAAIVKIVDGEMFSWYGSRLLKAPEYFGGLVESLIKVD